MITRTVELRHLRALLAVVEHGSFSRAAEALFVSQPAVSVLIKSLERHYGVPLLDRLGKRVVLTEAGAIVAEQARRMVTLAQEIEQAIGELRGLATGSVTIAASTLPGTYLLPRALRGVTGLYPGITVRLVIEDTKAVQRRVASNDADFGMVGQSDHPPPLVALPYMEDELVLIVGPEHRLAGQSRVSLAQLHGEKLISREPGSGTQAVIDARLAGTGIVGEVSMELSSVDAIKQAVIAGLGVAIVSRHAIELEVRAGALRPLRLHGVDLTRTIDIIYREGKRLSPAARKLLQALVPAKFI